MQSSVKTPIRAVAVSAIALIWGAAAGAQEAAADPAVAAASASEETTEETVSEIVVTANRRSQAINDVGMSISALSADQLTEQGVSDVRDLARLVPGFTFAESQKGSPIYTIRGVGFYEESLAASPAVSIYLDQVGYSFPIMAKAATLDLERVEVLKGPQGTLYGQNSTGGAINYIAAKPTSEPSAGGEIGFGRFGAFSAEGFASGPLSDIGSVRLAASADFGGDWQHSYSRDDRNGEQNLIRGRLLVDLEPSDRLSFMLNVNGFRDRSDTVAAALLRVTPQSPARLRPIVGAQTLAPQEPGAADWDSTLSLAGKQNYFQTSVQLEYELSDAMSVNSITSYQYFDQDNVRDTDGSALNVFSVHQTGEIESFFQELRLSGEAADDRLNWLLGGSYAVDDTTEANESFLGLTSSANAFTAFGLQPFQSVIALTNARITTKAAFGNVDFELSDQLSVSAGVRYTDSRNRFSGCMRDVDGNLAAGLTVIQTRTKASLPGSPAVISIPRGTCATLDRITFNPGLVRDNLNEDNVSWRLGVNFEPTSASLLYLTASRGYKSGNFPNINATTSISLSPVIQESVMAVEGGAKVDLGSFVHVDAAVFYYKYDDKQLRGRILDPSGVFGASEALVNVPKSRALGAEVSLTARPTDELTLGASAVYLDTKVNGSFSNYDPFGVVVNFAGDPYPFSPKWSLNGNFDYEAPLSDRLNGFIGANVSYQSRSTSAFGKSPLVEIDPYALVDAQIGIAGVSSDWRLTLWVKNVFDKYYWTDTFRQIDNLARHVGAPRTYGVRLSHRY
jgi:iron complex outermembrane receptor protein